ncbi:hypothetical protein GJ699_25250 [Duganella sp. FT80W]|uniref:Uncharacterized protein n=1 Tax=Duganella guangzhouensis TaxID=2666084 RepID=A0A6I2L6B5_9BURK|nr:hypothetical protein [Duganella guangzhouensis]MRW93300.1 hypothetical protein [Duganella guangzhouensis]
MSIEKRVDLQAAQVINAAIQIDTQWGCIRAWHYLAGRQVKPATAVRVLSKDGPRRCGDALHPAVRDARAKQAEHGMTQRAAVDTPKPAPRSNQSAAVAVERAIALSSSADRHYAESLLRMYGLNTATVMRVLFEPHRRRRAPENG